MCELENILHNEASINSNRQIPYSLMHAVHAVQCIGKIGVNHKPIPLAKIQKAATKIHKCVLTM